LSFQRRQESRKMPLRRLDYEHPSGCASCPAFVGYVFSLSAAHCGRGATFIHGYGVLPLLRSLLNPAGLTAHRSRGWSVAHPSAVHGTLNTYFAGMTRGEEARLTWFFLVKLLSCTMVTRSSAPNELFGSGADLSDFSTETVVEPRAFSFLT